MVLVHGNQQHILSLAGGNARCSSEQETISDGSLVRINLCLGRDAVFCMYVKGATAMVYERSTFSVKVIDKARRVRF